VWVYGRRDKYWSVARGASLAWFHNREHLQEYIGFMRQLAQAMGDELAALGPTDTVDIHLRLQVTSLSTVTVHCHCVLSLCTLLSLCTVTVYCHCVLSLCTVTV